MRCVPINTIERIVGLLDCPEVYEENTYGFAVNGNSLFKKWWNGDEDAKNLHLGEISETVINQIITLIKKAEGCTVSSTEICLEKIIDNYRVMYHLPPTTLDHAISFRRISFKRR